MVKVVGEAPEAVKQATCRQCAARLEYTPHEVREHSWKDYGGGMNTEGRISCPRCNSDVVVWSQ